MTKRYQGIIQALSKANQSLNELVSLRNHRRLLAQHLRHALNRFRGAQQVIRLHEITILNLQCRVGAYERHERHLQELVDHLRNELVLEKRASRALLDDMTRDLNAARSEACLLAQLHQEMSV
jgi:hypothetical protein